MQGGSRIQRPAAGKEQGDGSSGGSPWLHQIKPTLIPGYIRNCRGPACTAFLPESTTNLQIPGAAQYEKGHRTQGGKSLVALWESYVGKTHGSSLLGWQGIGTAQPSQPGLQADRSLQAALFQGRCNGSFPGDAVFLKTSICLFKPNQEPELDQEAALHPPSLLWEQAVSLYITKPHCGAGYPCSPRNSGFFPEG